MEKIELDDKAVAYAYVAKTLEGDVASEGYALPENIMRIHKNLTADFLEVEITPLYEMPEELKDSKDFYAE